MSERHGSEKGGEAKPRDASAEIVELHEGANLRSFPRARKALLVLGMHRSGTSAITRVLSLLGADLPQGLMPPVIGDNPAGFWESREIADTHDELLTSAGSAWDDVSPVPESWFSSGVASGFADRLLELLERDFAGSRLFVVKDPRIARLVPLWQSVLRQFSADPRYVLIVRNPLEVAASLKARNGFLPAKSYLLWLWHLLESERSTRRQPRAFVLFDELLRDWRGTVERLERQLQLSWPRRSAAAMVEIDEFLTVRLRHHEAGREELEAKSDAVTWVKRAYSAVLGAISREDGALTETLDSIRRELARADVAFAPLVAQGRLQLARKEAEIGRVTAELDSQRLEIDRLSSEIAQRDTDQAARGQEIQRLDQQLADRQAALEGLGAEIAQRDSALTAGGEEIQRLGNELADRQATLETLGAEIAQQDSELAARGEKIRRLGSELADRQATLETLGAEIAQRDSELAARGEKIRRLGSELADRQAALEALGAEVAERDGELAAKGEEIQRLGDELVTRDEERSRLGARLKHSQAVVEILRRQGRERENRLAAQRHDVELLRAGQERERRILETEARTQQTLLSLRGDEIARLRGELAEHRTGLVDLKQENARLAANLNMQSERLWELDQEAHARSLEMAARDGEIASLREELDSRGRENERLGRALAESTSSGEALSGLLGQSEKEIAALAGSLGAATGSIRSLERQVAEDRSRIRGFQGSRSWRVTRPLRWLTGSTRGLFGIGALAGWLAGSLRSRTRRLRRLRRRFEASGAGDLFDDGYYRAQVANPVEVGPDAVEHYLDRGCREGRDPHPLFDTAFYLQSDSPTVDEETDPLTQYFEIGAAQGRDPHPLFRSAFYLRGIAAPLAAGDNPLLHFLRVGATEGRAPHPLFDPTFYLTGNPDVAADGVNPLTHYVLFGGREGRSPHPLFDGSHYLEKNPQVGRAGENPLQHYIRVGSAQGRDPNSRFDSAYYQAANADSTGGPMTHLEHYLAVGSDRGARTRAAPAGEFPVLIIDHKLPMPDQDAGSLRMSNLISVLQDLDCRVTFLPHNLFDMEPYTEQLRERGVEVVTRLEAGSIAEHLEAHGDEYELVVICRVTVADDCFEEVRAHCRRAKIVFDTIDLQHLRKQRQAELEGDTALMEDARRTRERELELACSADLTWVVSPYEQSLLAREAPEARVGIVSTIHAIHGRKSGFAERRDLMFIGGFEHPPNIDAAAWLVEEILPRVHREEPDLRAFIIGSKPTDRVRQLASDRVIVTGYLPDVEPYFNRCRLSVAPLRYGAGIKGKVNHSLANGLPCVLTRVAAEGMGLVHGVDAMIADESEEFANSILAVYRDAELWQKLSDGGLDNVRRHFSFSVARAAVADSLGGLDPRWARQSQSVF